VLLKRNSGFSLEKAMPLEKIMLKLSSSVKGNGTDHFSYGKGDVLLDHGHERVFLLRPII